MRVLCGSFLFRIKKGNAVGESVQEIAPTDRTDLSGAKEPGGGDRSYAFLDDGNIVIFFAE